MGEPQIQSRWAVQLRHQPLQWGRDTGDPSTIHTFHTIVFCSAWWYRGSELSDHGLIFWKDLTKCFEPLGQGQPGPLLDTGSRDPATKPKDCFTRGSGASGCWEGC